jgi:hypothetical protein
MNVPQMLPLDFVQNRSFAQLPVFGDMVRRVDLKNYKQSSLKYRFYKFS